MIARRVHPLAQFRGNCAKGYNATMISSFFHAVVYDPLYNALVFLVGVIPTHDMGLAVILLTFIIRVILYPLSRRVVESQMAMKKIAPEIEELKKKHKSNSPEQSQAIFALYRERGIHPFSGLAIMLIQLPILFGLYFVFIGSGFPKVDSSILYSFVHAPSLVNMEFLGFVDMGQGHNIILALLAAVTQLIYARLSMGPRGSQTAGEASLSSDLAKSFDLQARYMFPALIGVAAYYLPAAAPLYYLTSNVLMIAQEYMSGRRF